MKVFEGGLPINSEHKLTTLFYPILGLPVLQILPLPFPDCWHKTCDDGNNIDEETVLDLLKIFQAFFKEVMGI